MYDLIFDILLLIGLFLLIIIYILLNDKSYNFIFNHKTWKLWSYFINNADKFKPSDIPTYDGSKIYLWKDEFNNIRYRTIVYSNGLSIIDNGYDDSSFILYFTDEYHSRKMAQLLTH